MTEDDPVVVESVAESEDVDWAAQFESWAKAARGTAIKYRTRGDAYGEQLALRRSATYDAAAKYVRLMPLDQAAQKMISEAAATGVRTPPLIGFDEAGLSHTASRAWQFCARKIDPDLPEVEKFWD